MTIFNNLLMPKITSLNWQIQEYYVNADDNYNLNNHDCATLLWWVEKRTMIWFLFKMHKVIYSYEKIAFWNFLTVDLLTNQSEHTWNVIIIFLYKHILGSKFVSFIHYKNIMYSKYIYGTDAISQPLLNAANLY